MMVLGFSARMLAALSAIGTLLFWVAVVAFTIPLQSKCAALCLASATVAAVTVGLIVYQRAVGNTPAPVAPPVAFLTGIVLPIIFVICGMVSVAVAGFVHGNEESDLPPAPTPAEREALARECTDQVKQAVLYGPAGPRPSYPGSRWLLAPTSTEMLPGGVFPYEGGSSTVCTNICTAYSQTVEIDWVKPHYLYRIWQKSGLNGKELVIPYHNAVFNTIPHTDSLIYLRGEPKQNGTLPQGPLPLKITAVDPDDGKARIRTWTTGQVVENRGSLEIDPVEWGPLPPTEVDGKKVTWRCTVEVSGVHDELRSDVMEYYRMAVQCGDFVCRAKAPYFSTCLFTSEEAQGANGPLTVLYTPHGGDQYIWVSFEIECHP